MPTNKELEQLVEAQAKELKELREMTKSVLQLSKADLVRKDPKVQQDDPKSVITLSEELQAPEGGGWLVQCQNKNFNGPIRKVKFTGGQAVLWADDGQQSVDHVHYFKYDYGYNIRPLGSKELNQAVKEMMAYQTSQESRPKTLEETLTRPASM